MVGRGIEDDKTQRSAWHKESRAVLGALPSINTIFFCPGQANLGPFLWLH